jgi:hypothetical protein
MPIPLITEMNKSNVELLAAEARLALQVVAAKHGLTLKQERGSYDPDAGSFTGKWSFVCVSEDGIPSDFARNAALFGLKAEDYGREFSTFGGTFTLCGIKPRNRKYPILGKCVRTGKTYKHVLAVINQLKEA